MIPKNQNCEVELEAHRGLELLPVHHEFPVVVVPLEFNGGRVMSRRAMGWAPRNLLSFVAPIPYQAGDAPSRESAETGP